jgi:phage tail-like protein
MDVNNTRFFMFRDRQEFAHRSSSFSWEDARGGLTLAQNQSLRIPASGTAESVSAWQAATPLVVDRFGQIGRIDTAGSGIEYNAGRGFFSLQDAELRDVVAPAGRFRDLSVGGDGRLVAAYGDSSESGVLVFHLGRRWVTSLTLDDPVVRSVIDIDNRVWCVTDTELVLCEGEPLPLPYRPSTDRFEPKRINPAPLSKRWAVPLPAGFQALALCTDEHSIIILMRDAADVQRIFVRPRNTSARDEFQSFSIDPTLPFVVDIGLVSARRVAALCLRESGDTAFRRKDCPVLDLNLATETGIATVIGERFPMLSQAVPRFATSMDGALRYQADADEAFPQFLPRPRKLHALNKPQYRSDAIVTLSRQLDSGVPQLTWHRIFMEGSIPSGCRVTLYAKAYDDPAERSATPFVQQPSWLWSARPSEIPFAEGLVESRRDESGLYEILLQRRQGNVRRLDGRYLQLRLRLQGDGRHSPCIHALRVYAPRMSYQESYLPEHFRQQEAYRSTDSGGNAVAANGADVRERMLAAVEGVLTPIEGQIAAATALTHPAAAPAEHLPWLAEALGTRLPEYWPERRHRSLLTHAGQLQRWRGTLAGACLAVDIATDGAVSRGEVAIVENFRLRRTMATILGVSMDDGDHPLTLGTGMSGNSVVGDSLILSEDDAREFLSLFSPDLEADSDEVAVREFFDRYSHQVSVLVHGNARDDQEAIVAALKEHLPAHVQWRLLETDHAFVLGAAPLLAVDTFLEKTPAPRTATLDDTYLGKEGVLTNPLALSPQDVNARSNSIGR